MHEGKAVMEYRGFTILAADSGKGYEISHPLNGELKACGWAPEVAEAKEVIDMRLTARDFVLDLKRKGPLH